MKSHNDSIFSDSYWILQYKSGEDASTLCRAGEQTRQIQIDTRCDASHATGWGMSLLKQSRWEHRALKKCKCKMSVSCCALAEWPGAALFLLSHRTQLSC